MRNCARCLAKITMTDSRALILENGDRVCADCADLLYAECSECHTTALVDDMFDTVFDNRICAECRPHYRDSGHHGGLIPREYALRTSDGAAIDTRHEEYYTHDDGTTFLSIEAYEEYCDEQKDQAENLLSFDACAIAWTMPNVTRQSFSTTKVPYMGFELESEANRNPRGVISAMGGNHNVERKWILKKDGSLHYGQEFVTAPMTLAQHVAHDWNTELAILRTHANADKSTCGLHVHLNLRSLSQLCLGKTLVFVNSLKTRGFIETIAGRNSSQWAALRAKALKDGKGYKNKDGKYVAMNVAAPTVEFRIFASTLRTNGVYRALEFVDALRVYMQTCSMRDTENSGMFTAWVRDNRATYPNLAEFFVRKGYAKAYSKPKPRAVAA